MKNRTALGRILEKEGLFRRSASLPLLSRTQEWWETPGWTFANEKSANAAASAISERFDVNAIAFKNDMEMDEGMSISVHAWAPLNREATEIERWLESRESGFRWTPKGYL